MESYAVAANTGPSNKLQYMAARMIVKNLENNAFYGPVMRLEDISTWTFEIPSHYSTDSEDSD